MRAPQAGGEHAHTAPEQQSTSHKVFECLYLIVLVSRTVSQFNVCDATRHFEEKGSSTQCPSCVDTTETWQTRLKTGLDSSSKSRTSTCKSSTTRNQVAHTATLHVQHSRVRTALDRSTTCFYVNTDPPHEHIKHHQNCSKDKSSPFECKQKCTETTVTLTKKHL